MNKFCEKMESDECAEIIKRHPELVLLSQQPVTWEGMLSVPVNFVEKSKVRLRFTLPKYPLFNEASINFGRNCAVLYRRDFSKKLSNLLKIAVSIPSFLKQLQLLIGEAQHNVFSRTNVADYSVISELETVLHSSCEVELSSSHGLDLVKLSVKDISVKLQRDASAPDAWRIIYSDLSQLQRSPLTIGASMTLRDAAKKLESQVESLEDAWVCLEDIDRNCWVIDPLKPKPHHLYRRIKVTPCLSLLINISPLQPSSLPNIRILGSESEVLKCRAIISENLQLWNPSNSLSENLLLLLNLQEFPQIPVTTENTDKDNGLFGDEECCICFSLELNEDELPDRICDNTKCRKHFHTVCLLQWLQLMPGNRVVFNQLYGACPHCGQDIPCPVE